jgi:phage terminase Nu1 subunit (DNA packaging protein)
VRTTLNLDRPLVERLMEVSGARTKTEAIHMAAREFIRRRTAERIKALAGKIPLVNNWKDLRELERREVEDLGR